MNPFSAARYVEFFLISTELFSIVIQVIFDSTKIQIRVIIDFSAVHFEVFQVYGISFVLFSFLLQGVQESIQNVRLRYILLLSIYRIFSWKWGLTMENQLMRIFSKRK